MEPLFYAWLVLISVVVSGLTLLTLVIALFNWNKKVTNPKYRYWHSLLETFTEAVQVAAIVFGIGTAFMGVIAVFQIIYNAAGGQ